MVNSDIYNQLIKSKNKKDIIVPIYKNEEQLDAISSKVDTLVTALKLKGISVKFDDEPTHEELVNAFRTYRGRPQLEKLPTAPDHPVVYLDDPDRPQPKYDVDREGGMSVTVGRLRECPVLDYKFIALGHNTVRGAAGAAILNAELMKIDGLL